MTYLEKQIQVYGLEKIKAIYHSTKNSDFISEFHCSSDTARTLFGPKKQDYKRQPRKSEPVVYPEDMREGIKTDKWEIPKEERYWEKEGFEIKQEGYIKTKLLP